MDPHLKKEIQKLRSELDALLSTLPIIERTVLKPVLNRFIHILEEIAERV